MFGRSLLVFLSILYLVPTLCEFGHLWLSLLASTGRMLMGAVCFWACGPVGVTVRLQGYSFDAKGRAVDIPRLYAAYMLFLIKNGRHHQAGRGQVVSVGDAALEVESARASLQKLEERQWTFRQSFQSRRATKGPQVNPRCNMLQ